MLKSKWHMYRMGLIDFWYYENEEFLFKDGHMLLRGSNGSGKSVTMQSFIPVLLDGNKNSERLDAFGSRSRRMETYLIDENSERTDRIAYLYLEFKRENSETYKTIGMGLHARKNKPMDSWYFVIEDGRRIGKDIQLVENRLAISKQALKNRIEHQLIDTQREYMARVNRALFQFPSIEDYKEAINLLVQVRSPKLSNSLKPTMINEILNNSLQPLSEEDLRPMTDAISSMDEIQNQLDQLKVSLASAKNIVRVYDQYNHALLKQRASVYVQKQKEEKTLTQAIARLNDQMDQNQNQKVILEQEQNRDKAQLEAIEQERASLLKQDMVQLAETLLKNKERLKNIQAQWNQKHQQKDTKADKYQDLRVEYKKQQDLLDSLQDQIVSLYQDLDTTQQEINYMGHSALKTEWLDHLDRSYSFDYAFGEIQKEIKEREDALRIFQSLDQENQYKQRLENDRAKNEESIQKNEDLLVDYQNQFVAIQEETKEKFARWNANNHWVVLNHDQMIQIQKWIVQFEKEDIYDEIETLIGDVYTQGLQKLLHEISRYERQKDDLSKQINDVQKELDKWKNQKDLVPEMDAWQKKSRDYLNEHSIPYRSLYEFLEFSTDCSQATKDAFEEQLMRMHLLDALVVPMSFKEQILQTTEMAERYVFTSKTIDKIETYWIEANPSIDSLFAHLGIEDASIQLLENGYQQGPIVGTISSQVPSVYIGKQSRALYRQKQIDILQKEYDAYYLSYQNTIARLDALSKDKQGIQQELNARPKKRDLESAKQDVFFQQEKLDRLYERQKEVLATIEKINETIRDYKQQIATIAERLGLPADKDVFISTKAAYQSYYRMLMSASTIHQKYLMQYELSLTQQERITEIEQDLDTIRVELDDLIQEKEKLAFIIDSQERQLHEQGYEKIKARIENINRLCNEIPDRMQNRARQMGELSQSMEHIQKELLQQSQDKEVKQAEVQVAQTEYEKELQLGYVTKDKASVLDILSLIDQKYGSLRSKETLVNDLQTVFYNNRNGLQEYALRIFDRNSTQNEVRMDLEAKYRGKKISFFVLVDKLQEDIETQRLLLAENDRHLIEDILVNTISRKIRNHINNSKHWIAGMNQYMRAMNTSSGLNLSLVWKSHKPENEDELSSNDLVKLLEKDVHLLKESDFQKLSTHFRSKIQLARQLCEQESVTEGFHQVVKRILDYRSWFDFQIWYEKKGERKKELTNATFYAFSGGEKAMAMYIPLFSAVAAKFEQAEVDAPVLIALDEAFAGVDEKNIDTMFGLIGKFGFDYIMNSQVLWGDYPSVKSLAIHELFRLNNAHYVTVISYEWNGHQKKMVERDV